MLYLIDGTGSRDPAAYRKDMERGFCFSLSKRNRNAFYLPGPTLFGAETWDIAEVMLAQVRSDVARDPRTRVVLAGHSRGGAAVMYVARKLKDDGIPVEAMVLFDAVRRARRRPLPESVRGALTSGVPALMVAGGVAAAVQITRDVLQMGDDPFDVVPGNVRRALHVVRDEAFSNHFLGTAEYRELAAAVHTRAVGAGHAMATYRTGTPAQRSRLDALLEMHAALRDACRFDCRVGPMRTGFGFGNTGLSEEPPCRLTVVPFRATHGAMGGAPLEVASYIRDPRYAAEIEAQEVVSMLQVQARVNAFLAEVNVYVNAGPPVEGARLAYVPQTRTSTQSLTATPPRR